MKFLAQHNKDQERVKYTNHIYAFTQQCGGEKVRMMSPEPNNTPSLGDLKLWVEKS